MYELTDSHYDYPGEFSSNRCFNCGLIYLGPRPKSERFGSYYSSDYANFRPPIESDRLAIMRWMRQGKLTRRRHLIESYSERTNGDLLDVGCVTGLFLNEMAESGWRVSGVETDSYATDFHRNESDLDVFTGFLQDTSYKSDSFDVITFWDVLEHTFSPPEELVNAAHLLRPGGMVALSVSNWNRVERRIFSKYWQGFDPPRQLYVFSDEILSSILDRTGFAILAQICFIPGYFSFILSLERWLKSRSLILSSLARSFYNHSGVRMPFEPWFSSNDLRRKGPIIAFFAQKKSQLGV